MSREAAVRAGQARPRSDRESSDGTRLAHPREPTLQPVAISDLRPTQITIGMREVDEKHRSWRDRMDKAEYVGSHVIPVVIGPARRPYVIDHHHLARALLEEEVTRVLTTTISDLSGMSKRPFWTVLDNRGWCHPYDARGRRVAFDEMPSRIADLVNDSFRSLAGELRRRGGYAKEILPFSEFLWADFLRRYIKRSLVEKDFDAALARALQLARSNDATYLPA
jgi:hypothetical protein